MDSPTTNSSQAITNNSSNNLALKSQPNSRLPNETSSTSASDSGLETSSDRLPRGNRPDLEPRIQLIKGGRFTINLFAGTALFAHGSHQSGQAELRPSAIKGALRYWLRVLLNSAKLSPHIEGEIFGTLNKKGALSVRIERIRRPRQSQQQLHLLPHRDHPGARQRSSAFPVATEFSVVGELSRVLSPEILGLLHATLWTAFILGGLGGRSRRGAGSLRILGGENLPSWMLVNKAYENGAALRAYLENGLNQVGVLLKAVSKSSSAAQPVNSPHFEPGAQVAIFDLGGGSEEEARARLMLSLRNFKNPAFGLPLRINGEWVAQENGKNRRFASPVHIRIVEINPSAPVKTQAAELTSQNTAPATENAVPALIAVTPETPSSAEIKPVAAEPDSPPHSWCGIVTVLSPLPQGEGVDGQKISQFLDSVKSPEFLPIAISFA